MGTAQFPRFRTLLEHYGFATNPFGDAPDPGLFYPAPSHIKVLDSLIGGIEKGISLQAITSRPGVGKTTILKLLVERLPQSEVILQRQPRLSASQSLKYLLARLGINAGAQDVVSLRQQLIKSAERKKKAGAPIVLLIDDAHSLRQESLAILRSLGPERCEQPADLQVILAALEDSIPNLQGLCHTGDRCNTYNLPPLSGTETSAYIAHRLRLSGYKGPDIFDRNSVSMIAEYSGGIPTEINTVCSKALRLSMERSSSREVDYRCVQQTIALHRSSFESEPPRDLGVSADIPFPVDERKIPPTTMVIEGVKHWFSRHDHSWSGTVGELLIELNEQANTSSELNGTWHDPALLLNTLAENSSKLAENGIAVSISTIESCLHVITLRRISSQPSSRGEVAAVSKGNRIPDEQVQEIEHSPQEPSDGSSQPTSTDGYPKTIFGLANRPGHEMEDEIAAGGQSPLMRAAKLLLIVAILAAVSLLWIHKASIINLTGNQSPGRPESIQPVRASASELQRLAEMGDTVSQLALADLYQSGEGVEKDYVTAVRWLRAAAAQGETQAAYKLANAYKVGQGIPASKVDAYCWFVLASDAGNTRSEEQIKELTPQLSDADIAAVRYQLGEMHLNGVGTKADPVSAYFWFQLAQAAGHPKAKQVKESLQLRMTEEQITSASQRASKWLQAHPSKFVRRPVGQPGANQR